MSDLLRPQDLQKIADDAETAKARETLALQKRIEREQQDLHEAFLGREIHPEAGARVNAAIRRAAEQGLRETQAIVFPSTFCNDHGRRINNNEPDWPASLEGFAKKAYEFYESELRPLGYKLEARILSYPGGVPGDVGVFLKW